MQVSTSSVSVEASTPVVNTESADVAAVRDHKVMVRLPLNTRGTFDGFYYSMLVRTPGATRGQGSNFSFAGARGFQWNTTVDGTSSRSPLFANSIGPAQSNMEMTSEIRIQLANDKAESGMPGGFYATYEVGSQRPSRVGVLVPRQLAHHGPEHLFDYGAVPRRERLRREPRRSGHQEPDFLLRDV
jgi:hypothetical protein